MPDYNLSGLSSRAFEQLIQALTAKFLGSSAIIFGDGPDGGREATIEGQLSYPTDAAPWEGYVVIQAKYRQRPHSITEDAKWALEQLKDEIKGYSTRTDNRRVPEYYIFATNVVLTPPQGSGSKDKALDILDRFKDQSGLKGYDVWDYDKLRVLLDDAEDIRRAYAAWVTPGDVLMTAVQWLERRKPNFEGILTNYLQKELLTDQYANLEQAGRAADERIPIARVLVDLPAFEEPLAEPPVEEEDDPNPQTGFIYQLLQAAALRLNDPNLRLPPGEDSHQTMRRQGPQLGRFVLVGGPGQGKTTIGQYACQLFRTAILRSRPRDLLSAEVSDALDTIEEGCRLQDLSVPTVRRFPLRIVLSKFGAALADQELPEVTSVLTYLVHHIKVRVGSDLATDDLREWLSSYPWLIVFDGLDEVPASSNRDEVLDAIRDFWIDLAGADALTVATTRPQGYNADFSPRLYHHSWLAPLSRTRALVYADRLATVRYSGDPDRRDKVLSRLRRASEAETTIRLMQTPLQVTIMATLVDRMGKPPQERWNLFRDYYEVIYQREVERDIPAARVLADYRPDIDTIHRRVGLLLQIESERSGGTDARLTADRFAEVVDGRLLEEGHGTDMRARLKASIMQAATDRLVFLVGLEAGQVGFEIRSLQEYMAAEGLMEGSDELVALRLGEIAPISSWRNVFLFAAGKCFVDRQHLRDTIHTICALLNDDPDDDIQHASLLGSQIALDLMEDGSARRQPKYWQLFARESIRVLDLMPSAAQSRLAALHTPDLDALYLEEITKRIERSSFPDRAGSLICLLHLARAGVHWARNLLDTHWPSDARQQILILQAGPGMDGWAMGKIRAEIGKFSALELRDILYGPLALNPLPNDSHEPTSLRSTISFLLERGSQFQVTMPSSGMSRGKLWVALQALSRADGEDSIAEVASIVPEHPDWHLVSAAIDFSRDPSAMNLAIQLRRAADHCGVLSATSSLASLGPWPFVACLFFADSREELLAMAVAAEAGVLGSKDTWLSAETRWLSKGVTAEDLYYTATQTNPYDARIDELGFPIFAVKSIHTSGAGYPATMDATELTEIYGSLEDGKLRRLFGDLLLKLYDSTTYMYLLDGRYSLEELPRKVSPWPPPDLINLYKDAATVRGQGHDFDVLYRAWQGGEFDDEWLDFFSELGKSLHYIVGTDPFNRFSNAVIKGYESNPERSGLVRLVALPSMPSDEFVPLPDPPALDEFDTLSLKLSALVIRLRSGHLSDNEADWARSVLSDVGEADVRLLHNVLAACRKLGSPASSRLALEIYRQLRGRWLELGGEAERALNEVLEKRTTKLGDERVWQLLQLPQDLRDVAY